MHAQDAFVKGMGGGGGGRGGNTVPWKAEYYVSSRFFREDGRTKKQNKINPLFEPKDIVF